MSMMTPTNLRDRSASRGRARRNDEDVRSRLDRAHEHPREHFVVFDDQKPTLFELPLFHHPPLATDSTAPTSNV
jgi:hypothetical protein